MKDRIDAIADGVENLSKRFDSLMERRNDASPLSERAVSTLLAQVNTMLRLRGDPEIKAGAKSGTELEALYRKLDK